jgi:hypothetical protein
MKILEIIIRCTAEPDKHAKKLHINYSRGKKYVQDLGELLTGTSPMYIYKPGALSPIGKCATCGAALQYEWSVVEKKDKDAKTNGQLKC